MKIRKNQTYSNKKYTSSSKASPSLATLGTVEADASEHYGAFNKKEFLGYAAIQKLSKIEDLKTCLDIGAGQCKQANYLRKFKKTVYTNDIENAKIDNEDFKYDYVGEFQKIDFKGKNFDATYCIHVLEHVLNVNEFLKKIISVTKEDGYICIVVPIRKPFIVSGHMTLWNAGLLLYNLIIAGLDCSENCMILQDDYDICLIVKAKKRSLSNDHLLHRNSGDLRKLKEYFPKELASDIDRYDCFDGDIFELNWEGKNEKK